MASVRRRQKHNPVSLPQSIASAFLWSLLSNLQFPRPGLNLLLMSISKDSPLTPSVSSYRVLKSTGNCRDSSILNFPQAREARKV